MSKVLRNVLISIIIALLFVSALFITYYVTIMKSEDNAMAIIVENGNEAIEKGEYLKGIKKYNEALEYDPENKELKNAIAHAYVCQASELEGEEAIEAYKEAIVYNSTNTNAYWGIASIYEDEGDEDSLLSILEQGFIDTNDENMRVKADNIIKERERIKAEEEERAREEAERLAIEEAHNDVLSKALPLFQAETIDFDAIKELLRTDEFITIVDEVIGDNSFYYGDRDDSGRRNGKGVAVYENGYFYYGDYVDDLRSGQGIYVRAVYSESSSIGSYIFEGTFENDKPNGTGTATSNYYKDKIGSSGLSKQVISGEYLDGYENGTMELNGTTKAGGSVKYTYKSENGVAVKSSNDDSGIKGQYIIAKSKDEKSNLTSDGSKRGVEGFVEQE